MLDAARRVYAEHGFQRSSVELLLRAANISRPTFYRLFADKREVISEVLARANADLVTVIPNAIAKASSLEEAVNLALDAYFDWGLRHVSTIGAFYREIHDRDSPAYEFRQQSTALFQSTLKSRAEAIGYSHLDPMLIDALFHVAEYVGGNCFASGNPSSDEILHARKIAGQIILASVPFIQGSGIV